MSLPSPVTPFWLEPQAPGSACFHWKIWIGVDQNLKIEATDSHREPTGEYAVRCVEQRSWAVIA
jgi:hypothetical protein